MSENAGKHGTLDGARCRDRTYDIRLVRAISPKRINDLGRLRRIKTALFRGYRSTKVAHAGGSATCQCQGDCNRAHTGPCPNQQGALAAGSRHPVRLEIVDGRLRSITVRKRPIEVQAWQYNGADNIDDAPAWVREYRCQMWDDKQKRHVMHGIKPDLSCFDCDWYLRIPTTDGIRGAVANDWLILEITGAVTSCKPHIFEATYEPA